MVLARRGAKCSKMTFAAGADRSQMRWRGRDSPSVDFPPGRLLLAAGRAAAVPSGLLADGGKINRQVPKCAFRRQGAAVPLLFEHAQEPGLTVHTVLHISFENGSSRFPIASPGLKRGFEHRRSLPQIVLTPGDVAPEKECVGGAWIGLAGMGEQRFRRHCLPDCELYLT